mmetsp:Transcript_37121/g.58436  ORF Transcript_37121/g.58436 Transcript_37121/m.58436 type:complete len:92 (-) Transcript_37121:22-297(-)
MFHKSPSFPKKRKLLFCYTAKHYKDLPDPNDIYSTLATLQECVSSPLAQMLLCMNDDPKLKPWTQLPDMLKETFFEQAKKEFEDVLDKLKK